MVLPSFSGTGAISGGETYMKVILKHDTRTVSTNDRTMLILNKQRDYTFCLSVLGLEVRRSRLLDKTDKYKEVKEISMYGSLGLILCSLLIGSWREAWDQN